VNSSGPVKSLEDFEPEEAIDASFLEDTPTHVTNTVTVSQPDVSSDSLVMIVILLLVVGRWRHSVVGLSVRERVYAFVFVVMY